MDTVMESSHAWICMTCMLPLVQKTVAAVMDGREHVIRLLYCPKCGRHLVPARVADGLSGAEESARRRPGTPGL